ncbi:MAG TPA: hypothetical protein PK513_08815 [Alphaproteobacteria bacterium]|nr:hypothetical protein [Alphaproteobacteria bacterium]USO06427.1 MAG: hypothetical protein H6859_04390 [Rhodospirillales bacterium]HOO82591.1 hypothetical protein [Alphaproteobacteria bacterium]
MRDIKNKKKIITVSCFLAFFAGNVYAEEIAAYRTALPVFTISSAQNAFQWNDPSYDYRLNTGAGERMPIEISAAETDTPLGADQTLSGNLAKSEEGEDYADKILAKIPYNKQLKSTWKLIDGDTDLYVKGLRVDRGNKGVEYSTSTMPFVGEVEGIKFKAEAGEENKIKFESSRIPFIGNVEGFKFKSSVGEESSVSVRYTTSLEKLGL